MQGGEQGPQTLKSLDLRTGDTLNMETGGRGFLVGGPVKNGHMNQGKLTLERDDFIIFIM